MRHRNAHGRTATLELTIHTRVGGAPQFVGAIAALTHAVAEPRRRDAVGVGRGVGTLEQARLVAVVLGAGRGLVCVVPAVVLAVAAPPERDALERPLAQELRTEIKGALLVIGIRMARETMICAVFVNSGYKNNNNK